ncbi:hypothetical protein Goklo_026274, partial [Gossypium klotzschianum]|nr:hypothetical protein [Gossypium klotzschianum]
MPVKLKKKTTSFCSTFCAVFRKAPLMLDLLRRFRESATITYLLRRLRNVTKFGSLATPLDGIFDTYGLLDELEKYTNAVNRWDLKAMEELPEYMKFLYEAIYNHWQYYIRAYLNEARWLHNGYNPSAEEYLENAWISIGIVLAMVYVIFGMVGQSINQYLPEFVENWFHSDLVCIPAYFVRFLDDLETSK